MANYYTFRVKLLHSRVGLTASMAERTPEIDRWRMPKGVNAVVTECRNTHFGVKFTETEKGCAWENDFDMQFAGPGANPRPYEWKWVKAAQWVRVYEYELVKTNIWMSTKCELHELMISSMSWGLIAGIAKCNNWNTKCLGNTPSDCPGHTLVPV